MTALILAVLLAAPAGSITGVVRVARMPDPPPATKIAKDAPVCGAQVVDDSLRVGEDRRLADVVVILRGAKPAAPPAPSTGAALDQVKCRYTPRVQAVTVGTELSLLNSDAVFHNVHANVAAGERQMTVFNVAMPLKGQKLPALLKKTGVHKIRCDAGHTWMTAWVHVVDHPWFAVTSTRGEFTIADVPPGSYTLEFWHEPAYGQGKAVVRAVPVEVREGKSSKSDALLEL